MDYRQPNPALTADQALQTSLSATDSDLMYKVNYQIQLAAAQGRTRIQLKEYLVPSQKRMLRHRGFVVLDIEDWSSWTPESTPKTASEWTTIISWAGNE